MSEDRHAASGGNEQAAGFVSTRRKNKWNVLDKPSNSLNCNSIGLPKQVEKCRICTIRRTETRVLLIYQSKQVRRYLISPMDGQDKFFEAKLTYNGRIIRKTAFSLMPQAGLPVDLILARQRESVYPGNGAVLSFYEKPTLPAQHTPTIQIPHNP